MNFCKTKAITLKRRDYSNTSQIATFYTLDYGKVQTLAKGSKRIGKKVLGSIDLLCYSELIFIKREGSGLHVLTEWELLEDFPAFRKNLEKFYAGCYVVELVGELTEEEEKNEPLFLCILDALCGLSGTKNPTVNLLALELQMLKHLGYLPSLEECVCCDGRLLRGSEAFYSPVHRGLLCKSCSGVDGYKRLSPGALQAAKFLVSSKAAGLGRLRLSPYLCGELRGLSADYLSFALNKPMDMWKYLR